MKDCPMQIEREENNMDKTLYFLVPRFGRWKIEKKIVNELNAPCYQVVDKYHKQFANDDMWIVMDRRIVMVSTKENMVCKVKNVFYGKKEKENEHKAC